MNKRTKNTETLQAAPLSVISGSNLCLCYLPHCIFLRAGHTYLAQKSHKLPFDIYSGIEPKLQSLPKPVLHCLSVLIFPSPAFALDAFRMALNRITTSIGVNKTLWYKPDELAEFFFFKIRQVRLQKYLQQKR